MKIYRVRPEFFDAFAADPDNDIVTDEKLHELARGWAQAETPDEMYAQILDQVDEISSSDLTAVEASTLIRELRVSHEMTQTQLADACGVTLRQIQRIEAGDTVITSVAYGTVVKIFSTLGL
jgi:DNA-binding XRE family transcriptional regulator